MPLSFSESHNGAVWPSWPIWPIIDENQLKTFKIGIMTDFHQKTTEKLTNTAQITINSLWRRQAIMANLAHN